MVSHEFAILTMALLLAVPCGQAAETRGVITKVDPPRNELVVDAKGVLAAAGTTLTFELPADVTRADRPGRRRKPAP